MKLNHLFQIGFIALGFVTVSAQADVLRWPQLCQNGTLVVQNKSAQNVRAWVQELTGNRRRETEVSLSPGRSVNVAISASQANSRFSLLHFANPTAMFATYVCDKSKLTSKATTLEGGVLTFTPSDLGENKLWLQNLFTDLNTVHLQYLDKAQRVVQEETLVLQPSEQRNYKLSSVKPFFHVRVFADDRFTAFSLTSGGAVLPVQVEPQPSVLDGEGAFFLVAPRSGAGDSFIVRIQNNEIIARARELVQHPEIEKMLFARIEKGHQGFNRNWQKLEKSFWSWSATEVTNFADLGSTACNGFPQMVEDDLDLWLQDPGRLCFWDYRVKKELSATEIAAP